MQQLTINTGKPKNNARIAGVLYLIIIFCGLFSEMFVRGTLIVPDDAAQTLANIKAAQGLYRIGFVSDMIMAICDVGVGVMFYILLRPVSKTWAMMAAFLRLAQAAIIGINLLNFYTPLLLLDSGADTVQLQQNVMLYLNMHQYGYLISGVFFGFSCVILSFLFYRSSYFPKLLGIMLLPAGISYLADCFTNFIAPEYAGVSEMMVVATAVITELAICAWLLIRGVKKGSVQD